VSVRGGCFIYSFVFLAEMRMALQRCLEERFGNACGCLFFFFFFCSLSLSLPRPRYVSAMASLFL
jgi:hypothetical protein